MKLGIAEDGMEADVMAVVRLKAPATEWTPRGGRHQAPPAQVEADRVELGEAVADHLDYQRGSWWDATECA
jgi:hypothetical protein